MDSLKKIFGSIGKFFLYILEFVIILYVIVITIFLLFRNKYGYTEINNTTLVPLKIDTAEYVKDGKEGNLLVVKNSSNLREGDLIYYYTIENEQYIVKSEYIKSIFKGDGNKLYTLADESGTTVVSTRVLGKYANQYGGFGTIFSILTSKFGFLLCIYIYKLYSLIMELKYEKVELNALNKEIKNDDKKEEKVETKEKVKKEEKVEPKEEVKVEKKVEPKEDISEEKEAPKVEEKPVIEKVEEVKATEDKETETEEIELL